MLTKFGCAEAFEPVVNAIGHKNFELQLAAVEALGHLYEQRALPVLELIVSGQSYLIAKNNLEQKNKLKETALNLILFLEKAKEKPATAEI